jgi:hypothetical protein
MNESTDPLEAELAALAPQPASPELKARIEDALADEPRRRPPPAKRSLARPGPVLALAAGLAAGLLVALLVQRGSRDLPAALPDEMPRPTLASAFDESLPSVWTYRRAVVGSPRELDELLDKHARSPDQTSDQRFQVSAFPMISTDLEHFLGDL